MNELLILGLLAILFAFVFGVLALIGIYALGKLNIFFIPAMQERLIAIDTGSSFSGKVIFHSHVRALSKTGYDIVDINSPDAQHGGLNLIERIIFKYTGMRYYGIPPFRKPHWAQQRLAHWVTQDGSTERAIETVDIFTPYLFTSMQEFAWEITDAEDQDGNPVNVRGSFFAMATNYYKPMYLIPDYMAQMTARIQNVMVDYVKRRSFVSNVGDLRTLRNDIVDPAALQDLLVEINSDIDSVGFAIHKMTIDDAELAGVDNAAIVTAQGGVVIAQLNGTAAVITAKAARDSRILEGEGEKGYLEQTAAGLAAHKNVDPALLVQMEVAKNFRNVTVLGGNPSILIPQVTAPQPPQKP